MTSEEGVRHKQDYNVHIHNAFEMLDEDGAPNPKQKEPVKEEPPKKDVRRTSDRDRPTPRVEGGDRRVDGGSARGRGGRGGGRGRGGRGGGTSEGGRERKEYDGHVSRTGKTREPKKEGAGKFNEGSVRDAIADGTSDLDRRRGSRRSRKPEGEEETPSVETKAEPEASAEPVADATTAPSDAPAASAVVAKEKEPEEEPDKSLSYDEYVATRKQAESDKAVKRREAQNDESQFKKAQVFIASEDKNPFVPAAEEKEKVKKVKKDKAKHISLDEFTATTNGGNAAGGRGGSRGGRGGRGRGGRGDPRALAVTETNFPALATKQETKK